jgi:uncharacterized protein involved in exopolysaccharide biosynthesis
LGSPFAHHRPAFCLRARLGAAPGFALDGTGKTSHYRNVTSSEAPCFPSHRSDHVPPSLREFAYHLHAERHRALTTFALVVAAFLVAAALLRPSYRATATLAVLPAPEYTVRGAAGSHDSSTVSLALDQIMKAETAILDSDDLHAATLRKLGPAAVYPAIYAPPPNRLGRLSGFCTPC